jgi:hypothetical protein
MFVGSSSEARWLIRGLSVNLDGEVEVHEWAATRWPLSRDTLDGVEEKLDDADYAAFILSGDDLAIIRDHEVSIPRDNVVLELGMSFGRLGRDHTFILIEMGSEVHTMSDIKGITIVPFELDSDVGKTVERARKVMANPSSKLLEAIEARGVRDRAGAREALQRGDTSRIDVIADGAVVLSESRDDLLERLRLAVEGGEQVPAKFQFAQADGGRYWMKLCRSRNYRYFTRAKAVLRGNAKPLAESVGNAAGTAAVDLVSLGCGDGRKDEMLLRALAAGLANGEYLYYYPIDISDILLVEAIRYIANHGPAKERYRCKAVLGDFTNLGMLRGITNYRHNTKLFSLLGNALGSFDEADILASVAGVMRPGDLVLIEANIGEPDDSKAMLNARAANQWDLSTLAALGIPRDSCELKQELKLEESIVPGTRTLVSLAVPKDKHIEYTLSGLHHYTLKQLIAQLEIELEVRFLNRINHEGVCLLLGQRVN